VGSRGHLYEALAAKSGHATRSCRLSDVAERRDANNHSVLAHRFGGAASACERPPTWPVTFVQAAGHVTVSGTVTQPCRSGTGAP